MSRAQGKLGTVEECVVAIASNFKLRGGPSSTGTVAQATKFHDDKDQYTGVHKNGGPTTVDLGTSDLKFITNRAAADVRGVQQ